MRNAYRGLAFAVAALVALQAAFIAFAVFGLAGWIEEGGTLDASAFAEGSTVEVGGAWSEVRPADRGPSQTSNLVREVITSDVSASF